MLERIFVPEEEVSLFSTSNRLERLQGKVIPIDNNYPINDRISAVKAKGHSQGHTTYELETDAGRLLFWGDIVHVPSVQFANPDLTWQLDSNQAEALETSGSPARHSGACGLAPGTGVAAPRHPIGRHVGAVALAETRNARFVKYRERLRCDGERESSRLSFMLYHPQIFAHGVDIECRGDALVAGERRSDRRSLDLEDIGAAGRLGK